MRSFIKIILLVFLCNNLVLSQWQIISNQGATAKIFFTDLNTGYSGSFTTASRTTNGGINWTVISNTGASVYYLNSLTGWHSGFPGKIEKTTNGGSSFTIQPTPTSEYLFDIFFVNSNTGWAVGGTSTEAILMTTNGGANWVSQSSGTSNGLFSVFFINEFTGWASGSQNGSKIIKTTNSGTNWVSLSISLNSVIYSIRFANDLTGWAVGGINNLELLFKTTNGGINWFAQNSSSNIGLRDCAPINVDTAFAIGYNGKIIKTINGGINWISQSSPTVNDLVSMKFLNPNTGYICGTNIVLKTTNGGVTFINNNTGSIPSNFELLQNYPNPFNPSTKIHYTVSNKSIIQIRIFDVSGKTINEFINKYKSPGEYELSFDGTNLPSGIYFYSLVADNNIIATKKMILLK